MQVALLQTIRDSVITWVTEAKGEIPKNQMGEIERQIKEQYPFFSNLEIKNAYLLNDDRIAVQLFDPRVNKYNFVVL